MLSLRLSRAVGGVPICMSELAHEQHMEYPVCLRDLLHKTGTRTKRVNVGVLRYTWLHSSAFARQNGIWPDWAFEQIFQASNGWSLHDYWLRASLGLIELEFHFEPWRVLDTFQDSYLWEHPDARTRLVALCRQAATDAGVDASRFDHVIAFVHFPPSPAGATGSPGDVVADQASGIPFNQHEIGHMLGFEHAFGPDGDWAYNDAYCVMGASGWMDHPIARPSAFDPIDVLDSSTFWRSERRLAAAALYRYSDPVIRDFESSSSVVRVDLPATVTLTALSEAALYDPIVVHVVGGIDPNQGIITVEYRLDSGDDAGVTPAVVVHSIGRRQPMKFQHEMLPIWFETAIPAQAGKTGGVGDAMCITVLDVSDDRRRVRVMLEGKKCQ
jgi:hypothetical protein